MSKTTLVLLPGMDGTGELFAPFIAALQDEFPIQVLRYPCACPLDYKELESLVRAALPTQGPYVILGESFSGPIAVAIAASRPAQLQGVILCCSFVRSPTRVPTSLRWMVSLLPIGLVPISVLTRLLLGRFSTNPLRVLLGRAIAQVSPSVWRSRLLAGMSVDRTAEAAAIDVPLLYLRARRDHLVPRSASALISRLNPRTKVAELDAPHFLLQCAPAPAAVVVEAFMREVGNSR